MTSNRPSSAKRPRPAKTQLTYRAGGELPPQAQRSVLDGSPVLRCEESRIFVHLQDGDLIKHPVGKPDRWELYRDRKFYAAWDD